MCAFRCYVRRFQKCTKHATWKKIQVNFIRLSLYSTTVYTEKWYWYFTASFWIKMKSLFIMQNNVRTETTLINIIRHTICFCLRAWAQCNGKQCFLIVTDSLPFFSLSLSLSFTCNAYEPYALLFQLYFFLSCKVKVVSFYAIQIKATTRNGQKFNVCKQRFYHAWQNKVAASKAIHRNTTQPMGEHTKKKRREVTMKFSTQLEISAN